jgi:hypothetical protein
MIILPTKCQPPWYPLWITPYAAVAANIHRYPACRGGTYARAARGPRLPRFRRTRIADLRRDLFIGLFVLGLLMGTALVLLIIAI